MKAYNSQFKAWQAGASAITSLGIDTHKLFKQAAKEPEKDLTMDALERVVFKPLVSAAKIMNQLMDSAEGPTQADIDAAQAAASRIADLLPTTSKRCALAGPFSGK
jgi:hypothetical protein